MTVHFHFFRFKLYEFGRYMRMHSIKPLFDCTEIYIGIGSARRNAGGKDDFQNTVHIHTRIHNVFAQRSLHRALICESVHGAK